MGRLAGHSGRDTLRALEALGFRQVRQRGSHVVMRLDQPDGNTRGCVVPLHKELAEGTLRGILKQAGVDVDEFLARL
mgnify:CR=1 FL=1